MPLDTIHDDTKFFELLKEERKQISERRKRFVFGFLGFSIAVIGIACYYKLKE